MPEPTLTTMRTPHHELPFLFPAQAQKEAFINEAFVRLDALVQPVAQGELVAPPPAPVSGASYIVGAGATGAWLGHEGAIAIWAETLWLFAQPRDGAQVHDAASGSLAVFSSAHGWRRATRPPAVVGGSVQDAEARAAIAAIVAGLHSLGIFSA